MSGMVVDEMGALEGDREHGVTACQAATVLLTMGSDRGKHVSRNMQGDLLRTLQSIPPARNITLAWLLL